MPLITETYYLSLTQDNRGILRLRCSQDDTLRTVNLKLYNNGSIFVIPSGVSASISGVKQNGAVFSKPCTISQNRESVVLQLSSDITNIDGIIVAEIVLNDGEGGRLGTSNFIIQIEKNPIRAGIVQDTETPIEYINDFIEKIQTLTARLNNLITPSGDPSLAEVVDARIGILDSTTYQTLGARLNAEFQRLSNALNGATILKSTGDTTDRTSEILSKLNTYGTCKLGKGDFYVKNLVMPEDSMLVGSGNATRIVLLGSETNTYIVKPKSGCIIENISFYGGFIGTYSELIAVSDARRHCIILDKFNDVNSENVILSNISINNFVGSAIVQRYTTGCHCKDVVINMCYAGIDISNASYNGLCTNVYMNDTRYGIVQNGSNFVFSGCISKDSKHHIMSDQQNTECIFSSCTFFDSSLETTSTLAYLSNARNGFVFDNCMFDSSLRMGLNACDGIVIKGTNFVGSDTFAITVSNGRNTLLLITDCIADVEPVVTNAGTAARITSCYLKDGTAWSISEADITVDEELSDESENPIQNRAVASAISEINESLAPYNAVDILVGKITKASGTINGFTFTWVGDVCTVTGSATGYGANILRTSVALPSDVIPGNTYFVKYSTTDVNVMLRIIWKTSDNTDIRADYFTGDMAITVPSTAEKWTISLFIMNTVTLSSAVTVSGIAMLNTRSNAELLSLINALPSDYFTARGMVADGTNLNTVKQPGYYVLSTGMNYTNSPLATGVAGILVVFPATANSIEQVVYSMGEPTAVKVYARSAILGNFSFDWKEVSGEQVVNEYVSEHYENTYDITCSPTITTDTNNYLASTGDNTDRTGDIQTMLNTTGVCHLGPGKFVVTGVSVPDYSALIGSGDRTVIVLADSVTTGYAVKLNNFSSVYGLRINGGSTAQGTSSSVGTRHGILFEGTKQSGQTDGTTKKKSKIDKCTINNFSGGGITLIGTGVDLDSNLLISDCFVDHCGAGLYIPYYSEFHRISNCAFTYNYYGCIDNGGNNNFANCDFSGNKIGILIDNSTNQSPNVAHGSFANCSVNHSYSDAGVINEGTAIKLLKANLGEIFTGMQIFYGAIVIDDCVGIRFVGANVGSKVPITITDSTVVTFSDCTFKESPTHADSTFTQSNNTVLKFTECYLRDGTAYNPMSN